MDPAQRQDPYPGADRRLEQRVSEPNAAKRGEPSAISQDAGAGCSEPNRYYELDRSARFGRGARGAAEDVEGLVVGESNELEIIRRRVYTYSITFKRPGGMRRLITKWMSA